MAPTRPSSCGTPRPSRILLRLAPCGRRRAGASTLRSGEGTSRGGTSAMSGPKVFYVVTREELVARCEAQLRLLDAAVAEWKRTCELNNAANAKEIDDVAARRSALRG